MSQKRLTYYNTVTNMLHLYFIKFERGIRRRQKKGKYK